MIEQWGNLQDQIKKTIGQNNYKTWIEPLQFRGMSDDGVVTLQAPTNFFGTYVSQNFGDMLLAQIASVTPTARQLNFQAGLANPAPASATTTADEPVDPIAPAQVSSSRDTQTPGAPLDMRFTFETFVVGKPNELAHAAARRVAEGGPVTFNPLFLYGRCGSGKNPFDARYCLGEIPPQPRGPGAVSVGRTIHVSLCPILAGTQDDGFQRDVPLRRCVDGG